MHDLSMLEAAAVRAYDRTLQERWGPRPLDVVLFGSRSRGDAGPDSGFDVLVVLDAPSPEDLSEGQGFIIDGTITFYSSGICIAIASYGLRGVVSWFTRWFRRGTQSLPLADAGRIQGVRAIAWQLAEQRIAAAP